MFLKYKFLFLFVRVNHFLTVQTVVYQLEENDAAYTLPIPKEVLEYNTGMKNNERGVRPVVETINY